MATQDELEDLFGEAPAGDGYADEGDWGNDAAFHEYYDEGDDAEGNAERSKRGRGQGRSTGGGMPALDEEVNEFERALDRINQSKKQRRIGPMKRTEAKRQAERLVDRLNEIHKIDKAAVEQGLPAGKKLQYMSDVKRLVNRKGFQVQFLMDQGLLELRKWIEPIDLGNGRRADVPVEVQRGVIECVQALMPFINKQDVKDSQVGKALRAISEDTKNPTNVRLSSSLLVTELVNIVIGLKRPRSEMEGADPDAQAADLNDKRLIENEEAEEADQHGRKIAKIDPLQKAVNEQLKSRGQAARDLDKIVIAKTELDQQRQWLPDEEFQKVIDSRSDFRHAVMPVEKPVFDPASAPPSAAPVRVKKGEDPNTTIGRVDAQLKTLSDPNKKKWKSTVGQVSVSGRSIVYNF